MSNITSVSDSDLAESKYKEQQLIKRWIQANHHKPAITTLRPDKKSSLLKKGTSKRVIGAFPSINQIFFICKNPNLIKKGNFLFYFEEKLNETNFKGVVLLKDCTVESMKFYENMSNVLVIEPRYPNRLLKFDAQVAMQAKQVSKKYYVSCPTRAIMDDWKKAIELAGKFSQIVLPEKEQNAAIGVDGENLERLLRTTSMRSRVNDYQLAAVSFSLSGVTEQEDLAAKRLTKRVERFEDLANDFGPIALS